MAEPRIRPGVYKHFKGGIYSVLLIAEDCTDGSPYNGSDVVVYQSVGQIPVKTYTRSYEQFASPVDIAKYPTAKQKFRFERVEV